MSENEGIPLWDSVTHPLASVLELAFGCHHRKLSRVFTIDGHSYKVCCDCGANFDYSLRTMSSPIAVGCSRHCCAFMPSVAAVSSRALPRAEWVLSQP